MVSTEEGGVEVAVDMELTCEEEGSPILVVKQCDHAHGINGGCIQESELMA